MSGDICTRAVNITGSAATWLSAAATGVLPEPQFSWGALRLIEIMALRYPQPGSIHGFELNQCRMLPGATFPSLFLPLIFNILPAGLCSPGLQSCTLCSACSASACCPPPCKPNIQQHNSGSSESYSGHRESENTKSGPGSPGETLNLQQHSI